MAKKLDTTPDGIICSQCGADQPPYNFFRYSNKYSRDFFIRIPPRSDVCWDCAGMYECIKCGVTQLSNEFRIGGRICYTCKGVKTPRRTLTAAQIQAQREVFVSVAVEVPETLKSDEWGE